MDLDVVRHALRTARQFGYREVELQLGEDHFHAKLAPGPQAPQTPARTSAATLEEDHKFAAIASNAVGYYREGDTPLAVDAIVKKGDIVALIVALGIENEVESKWSGRVVEVLVEPGQAVQYGQPLARLSVDE